MPLNWSELGLNIFQFISNLYGFFNINSWSRSHHMYAGKRLMVTPSLPSGKNQMGQAPLITQTRKEARNSCGQGEGFLKIFLGYKNSGSLGIALEKFFGNLQPVPRKHFLHTAPWFFKSPIQTVQTASHCMQLQVLGWELGVLIQDCFMMGSHSSLTVWPGCLATSWSGPS